MTGRRLKPEELDLWNKVARTTQTMHFEPQELTKSPMEQAIEIPEPLEIKPFQIGENPRPNPARALAKPSPKINMDKKTFGKLGKGKLTPEARIDLHGMTQDQAHPALIGFILRAHGANKRLVLVITGKGKDKEDRGPIPVRRGVLRHNVPQWLNVPPLGPLVLQVKEAHQKHGGGGAYYVYLRRRK